jgi:hypothetical protein
MLNWIVKTKARSASNGLPQIYLFFRKGPDNIAGAKESEKSLNRKQNASVTLEEVNNFF